jgi:FkbM family methyltransferase
MNNNQPLVFDIGYNQGNFSREIVSLYPEAKIIGIDGHPMYQDIFNTNPLSNVTFIHGVVSETCEKEITFYICDSNPGINSINPEWINTIRHSHYFDQTKREIKVRSTTLDRLISVYGVPDIIKLDIEGAEAMALRGLSQKCGVVTLEWSEEFFHETLTCVDILQKLGYTQFASDSHWEGTHERIVEYNTNLEYTSWDNLNLNTNIEPTRKLRWGMLYAK